MDRIYKQIGAGAYHSDAKDVSQLRAFVANHFVFAQAGAFETHIALHTGIERRDPTRDWRVVELCMRMPPEQFVYQGSERSLLRRSMRGIVPDAIRLNYTHRGVQGSDFAQRLAPKWQKVRADAQLAIEDPLLQNVLNTTYLKEILQQLEVAPDDTKSDKVMDILISIILKKFVHAA